MRAPLFILGCPRSGTTFLASLLRLTSYGTPFESQFIVKRHDRLANYDSLERFESFSKLLADILRERAILQRKLKVDPRRAFEELSPPTYRSVVEYVCTRVALGYNGDGSSWGDKTPHYTLRIESLAELFPDARYIYLARDGRDVALSLLAKPWGPATFYSCAKLWRRYINKRSDLSRLIPKQRVLFVQYERLLREPSAEISRIFGFLDEQPADLETFVGATKRGNYDKWKARMTPRQQHVFEAVAGASLRELGYETVFEEARVTASQAALYSLADRIKRSRHLVRLNVIDSIAIRLFGKEPFKGDDE